MEDILASIRRILNEGEGAEATAEATPETAKEAVAEAAPVVAAEAAPAAPAPATASATDAAPAKPEDVFILDAEMMVTETADTTATADAAPIASTETVAAASQSVGALKKALTERHASVYKGAAISIEEIVREEVRPQLKGWLDANLPAIVERLVRAEIERVVAREML
jgi:cell pole-organizing protein PopZ